MPNLNDLITHAWHLDDADEGPYVDAIGDWDLSEVGNPQGAVAGKLNDAVDFLGITDALSLSDRDGLTPAGSFSRAAWVKYSISGAVISKSDANAADQEWILDIVTQLPRFRIGNGTSLTAVAWGSTISTGAWHLLCCYFDATNDLIGISVDGAAFITASFTGTMPNGAAPFTVGDPNGMGSTSSLIGVVDEVMFFDGYVLTDQDADDLWNGGSGNFYPFSVTHHATGNAEAVMTAAAVLSQTNAVAGNSEAVSSSAAILSLTHLAAGNAEAVVSSTSTLGLVYQAAGNAEAVTTATAILSQTHGASGNAEALTSSTSRLFTGSIVACAHATVAPQWEVAISIAPRWKATISIAPRWKATSTFTKC